MTAPDPRDSVERIVAEMRKMAADRWTPYGVRQDVVAWADRLAALPQPFTPNEKLAKAMERASHGGEDVAALQAEVARLRENDRLQMERAIRAEAALREAQELLRETGRFLDPRHYAAQIAKLTAFFGKGAAIGGTGDA